MRALVSGHQAEEAHGEENDADVQMEKPLPADIVESDDFLDNEIHEALTLSELVLYGPDYPALMWIVQHVMDRERNSTR